MPPLAGLAVRGMRPAPLAVLAQRDAVRIVALGLVGLVVPALALLAREGDGDPDVSAGHLTAAPRVVLHAGQRKTPPARGRRHRIARGVRGEAAGRPAPGAPAGPASSSAGSRARR